MLYLCNRSKCKNCDALCHFTEEKDFEKEVIFKEPMNNMDGIEALRYIADEKLNGKDVDILEEAAILLYAANEIERSRT